MYLRAPLRSSLAVSVPRAVAEGIGRGVRSTRRAAGRGDALCEALGTRKRDAPLCDFPLCGVRLSRLLLNRPHRSRAGPRGMRDMSVSRTFVRPSRIGPR